MSRKNWNPIASSTVLQINDTMHRMQNQDLCIFFNSIQPINENQHQCTITWRNHSSGRENSGSSFTNLRQYQHILKNNSFHCLLFDGSIIRVCFKFEDNILKSQNLLWWPSPSNFNELLQDFCASDILDEFLESKEWSDNLIMRSPIRIDFDSENNTIKHPHSHMHIEDYNTRLNTNNPICFNKFIDFIFRNFYPDKELRFNKMDFIDYKIDDLENLDYISSTINIGKKFSI